MSAVSDVTIIESNEKKAHELLLKSNLKPVNDIIRVAFRKRDNQILTIDNPEVYKTAAGNYVVFGEVMVDNFTEKLALAQQEAHHTNILPPPTKSIDDISQDMRRTIRQNSEEEEGDDADNERLDFDGVKPEDVLQIVDYAMVSEKVAIRTLREHNGDIVSSLMSFSK